METQAYHAPLDSRRRANRPRTALNAILGFAVSIIGLVPAAMEVAVLLVERSSSPRVRQADRVGAIAVVSFLVLPVLFFFSFRIARARSRGPKCASRDLRVVRVFTAVFLAQQMLHATLLDGASAGAPLDYLSLALCLPTAFLILLTRRAIERMSDQPGREQRGFPVLLQGATFDTPIPPASNNLGERQSLPWSGLTTIFAMAMALGYAAHVATLWAIFAEAMQGAASFSSIGSYANAPGIHAPAIPPEWIGLGCGVTLGSCGLFWLAWLIACLAAGPKWRWAAIVFVIVTMLAQALQPYAKYIESSRGLIYFSPYNSPPVFDYSSSSPLAMFGKFALPIVLLYFLCSRLGAAVFHSRP
jgi:hypothetical protein